MRTTFKSIELPKKLAKAIAHVFPALKLSTCQEWAARLCGYRNWHELDMRTRNFTGEPTPDPFFAEYMALDQGFGPDHDSPSVRAKRDRIEYQYEVLQELTGSLGAIFQGCHEPYWDIMTLAHKGVPGTRLNFGSGTPLFRALQFPWFGLEDGAKCVQDEGELRIDDWEEPVYLIEGFASGRQRDKWLCGASGLTQADLSALKEEFPGIAPRVGGGSVIRLAADQQGRPVIVQSTRHRYWWQRISDHRMLGGFSLTARLCARQDDSLDDELQLCIHDAWSVLPVDLDTMILVPYGPGVDTVGRFLGTRLGMGVMAGAVTFACDDRPASKILAENFRDLVCDFTRDSAAMDIDEILKPEVVRYVPKYLQHNFSVLKSELV